MSRYWRRRSWSRSWCWAPTGSTAARLRCPCRSRDSRRRARRAALRAATGAGGASWWRRCEAACTARAQQSARAGVSPMWRTKRQRDGCGRRAATNQRRKQAMRSPRKAPQELAHHGASFGRWAPADSAVQPRPRARRPRQRYSAAVEHAHACACGAARAAHAASPHLSAAAPLLRQQRSAQRHRVAGAQRTERGATWPKIQVWTVWVLVKKKKKKKKFHELHFRRTVLTKSQLAACTASAVLRAALLAASAAADDPATCFPCVIEAPKSHRQQRESTTTTAAHRASGSAGVPHAASVGVSSVQAHLLPSTQWLEAAIAAQACHA